MLILAFLNLVAGVNNPPWDATSIKEAPGGEVKFLTRGFDWFITIERFLKETNLKKIANKNSTRNNAI